MLGFSCCVRSGLPPTFSDPASRVRIATGYGFISRASRAVDGQLFLHPGKSLGMSEIQEFRTKKPDARRAAIFGGAQFVQHFGIGAQRDGRAVLCQSRSAELGRRRIGRIGAERLHAPAHRFDALRRRDSR